jgi:hypothetical protein
MSLLKSPIAGALVLGAVLALGCTGSNDGAPDASQVANTLRASDLYPDGGCAGCGLPCAKESDCGTGLVCGYKVEDGCAAQGVCVPRWPLIGQAACAALVQSCGCDGTVVTTGCNYYAGYAPAPVSPGNFSCMEDGGSEAGICGGRGQACGPEACCEGLSCSPPGANAPVPGSCVPL